MPIFLILIFLFNGLLFADFKPTLLGVMYGEKNGDWFGRELSGSGDINGDGYDDFAINGANKMYIYLGSSKFDASPNIIISRTDGFTDVEMGGDVNGDGFADILGACSVDNQVFLYYGGSPLDTIPDVIFAGTDREFGFTSSISGDVNGDGYDDVLISSDNGGHVYLFLGGPDMDTKVDATFYEGGGLLGGSIACGDINGDGYDDIIIGSTYFAYIYLGSQKLDTIYDYRLQPIEYAGQSTCTGDINADGFSDIIIGGNHHTFIYYGSTNIDTSYKVSIDLTGEFAIGKFNKDHFWDLLIGNGYAYGGLGGAYVYLGGNPMDSVFDWGGMGQGIGNFGFSVANAGDVNGDGVDDMLIGEPGYYFDRNQGRVFLLSGDTSMVSSVDKGKSFVAGSFRLFQNYPNPFNGITKIPYQLPEGKWNVKMKIYDILGKEIVTLVNKKQMGGTYYVKWNGKDKNGEEVISGIYFIVLRAGEFYLRKKVLFVK